MLKEKTFVIQKINTLLLDMDVDTVLAFYSVANRMTEKKGGSKYEYRRKKSKNHTDNQKYN